MRAASLLAPAKVNLFLHVAPPAPDGFHPLASLMAFADVGDRLSLEPAGPGEEGGLEVVGRFAADLAATPEADNLVSRAAAGLLLRAGVTPPPYRLRLDKALPVASGLGGGSSDAGAALKLVRDAFAPELDDAVLERAAAELGSDGPACLHARTVIAEGRGERLSTAPRLPPLPTVLVNPGMACPTGPVYRAYDRTATGAADLPPMPSAFAEVEAVIAFLRDCRNDLEAPAITVAPLVAEVLARLRALEGVGLARLSGSGATCFALFATAEAAEVGAATLQRVEPQWWVQPCTLG